MLKLTSKQIVNWNILFHYMKSVGGRYNHNRFVNSERDYRHLANVPVCALSFVYMSGKFRLPKVSYFSVLSHNPYLIEKIEFIFGEGSFNGIFKCAPYVLGSIEIDGEGFFQHHDYTMEKALQYLRMAVFGEEVGVPMNPVSTTNVKITVKTSVHEYAFSTLEAAKDFINNNDFIKDYKIIKKTTVIEEIII